MKTEHELRKDAQKGEKAERLRNDPMLKDIIQDMRQTCYHNIETSHFSKQDEREELYRMLKVIDKFEQELTKIVRKGVKSNNLLKNLLNRGSK